MTPTATRYEFTPAELFVGDPMATAYLHDSHVITVEWRGGDRWAVSLGHGWSSQRVWCERDGEWEWEPSPSNRDVEFFTRCRYDLTTALEIGSRLAADRETP